MSVQGGGPTTVTPGEHTPYPPFEHPIPRTPSGPPVIPAPRPAGMLVALRGDIVGEAVREALEAAYRSPAHLPAPGGGGLGRPAGLLLGFFAERYLGSEGELNLLKDTGQVPRHITMETMREASAAFSRAGGLSPAFIEGFDTDQRGRFLTGAAVLGRQAGALSPDEMRGALDAVRADIAGSPAPRTTGGEDPPRVDTAVLTLGGDRFTLERAGESWTVRTPAGDELDVQGAAGRAEVAEIVKEVWLQGGMPGSVPPESGLRLGDAQFQIRGANGTYALETPSGAVAWRLLADSLDEAALAAEEVWLRGDVPGFPPPSSPLTLDPGSGLRATILGGGSGPFGLGDAQGRFLATIEAGSLAEASELMKEAFRTGHLAAVGLTPPSASAPRIEPQPVPAPIPQEVPGPVPQRIPVPVPQEVPGAVPQPAFPERVPQTVPGPIPQEVPSVARPAGPAGGGGTAPDDATPAPPEAPPAADAAAGGAGATPPGTPPAPPGADVPSEPDDADAVPGRLAANRFVRAPSLFHPQPERFDAAIEAWAGEVERALESGDPRRSSLPAILGTIAPEANALAADLFPGTGVARDYGVERLQGARSTELTHRLFAGYIDPTLDFIARDWPNVVDRRTGAPPSFPASELRERLAAADPDALALEHRASMASPEGPLTTAVTRFGPGPASTGHPFRITTVYPADPGEIARNKEALALTWEEMQRIPAGDEAAIGATASFLYDYNRLYWHVHGDGEIGLALAAGYLAANGFHMPQVRSDLDLNERSFQTTRREFVEGFVGGTFFAEPFGPAADR